MKALHPRAAPNNSLLQPWQAASWIWLPSGIDQQEPPGDCAFRTTYVPSGPSRAAVSANVLITADDYFTLFVNGQEIGGTRTPANDGQTVWATAIGYAVTLNTKGVAPVVFAVRATNAAQGAAGLLVAIQLNLADGSTATISTGTSNWRATNDIPQNFASPDANDSGWSSTAVIEKNGGDAPWGGVVVPSDLTTVALKPAPAPSGTTKSNTPNGPTTAPQGTTIIVATTVVTGADGSTHTITSTSTNTSPSATQDAGGVPQLTPLVLKPPSHATENGGTSTSTLAGGAGAANGGTASAQSKPPVGAIVGGIIGGLVLFLLLLALLLHHRKRSHGAFTPAAASESMHQIRTAATIAPSSARSPSSAPSPLTTPSSLVPHLQPTPFTLRVQNDDGLRSTSHHEKAGIITPKWEPYGGARTPEHERTTGELGVTMSRLHELAEELNRGLAEQGPDTPRLMLVSGRDAGLVGAGSTEGSVRDQGWESEMGPPAYDGRRGP
ncbi:hypothetical protein FPV67DRAFT_1667876 [Lyophyllum atratum]|nr:hypothetical protein FPV67DRAFT_1667876 [Lyophyllum atratum]